MPKYGDPDAPPGAEHLGVDFRVYNHDYVAWLRDRSEVTIARAEESRGAAGGVKMRIIVLGKRPGASC